MNRLKPTIRTVLPPDPPPETPPPLPVVPAKPRSSPWRTFLVRLAMVLVITGSVAIALWSLFHRLLPVSQRLRDRTTEMSRLAQEVEQLDLRWNPAQAERIESLYEETQAALFDGETELVDWGDALEQQALSLGLHPTFAWSEPIAESEQDSALRHRTLTLGVQPLEILGIQTSSYRRLLNLVQTLDLSTKRADLVAVSAVGDTNAVQRLEAVFKLWSKEGDEP